jgi:hypothetical protein
LAAIEVVDRVIERPAPPPPASGSPKAEVRRSPGNIDDWLEQLEQLVKALDTGRIYLRDLAQLRPAIESVMEAYDRRARRR